MMPLTAYLAYKRDAEHHLQIEVMSRDALENEFGVVPVKARVRRVFKSNINLQPDDEVCFCLKAFRKPARFPPDAGGWIEYEEFRTIRYLEVFLNGQRDALSIAAFGALHYSIEKLTDKPRIRRPSRIKVAIAWAMFNMPRLLPW